MAKEETISGENDTATAAAMPATIVENNATDSTAAEGLEEEEAAADLDGKKRRKKRSTIKINTIKSTPYILLIMINNDNLICTLFFNSKRLQCHVRGRSHVPGEERPTGRKKRLCDFQADQAIG